MVARAYKSWLAEAGGLRIESQPGFYILRLLSQNKINKMKKKKNRKPTWDFHSLYQESDPFNSLWHKPKISTPLEAKARGLQIQKPAWSNLV